MSLFTDKLVHGVIILQLLNDVFFLSEKDKHMYRTILELSYKISKQALILFTIIILSSSN